MKKIDLHNLFIKTLDKIPIKLLRYLLSLNNFENIVYGKEYKSYKLFLEENKNNYDNTQQLVKLINNAIDNVPYYKKYTRINNKDTFKSKIPFVSKDIISENISQFINEKINFSHYSESTTGGTSGKTLQLFIPKNRYIVELGTMHKLWENVDFKNHVRAVIRNHQLPENKDYIINPITKEYIFDGFRLNDQYFQLIYDVIKKDNIQFIHAYPSIAFVFCKFLYKKKLDTSFIKSFLSGF